MNTTVIVLIMVVLTVGGVAWVMVATRPVVAAPAPAGSERIVLGMGCFWGAEKRLAALPGVTTVVGYAGGERANPSYDAVLRDERRGTGRNHAEVVQVTFDPQRVSVAQVLATFWAGHDPTQGDRQGNDRGSNYRSAIYYTTPAQEQVARVTRAQYQLALTMAGFGPITTEIAPLTHFYPAEPEHQQYLVRNPHGYCGLGGTGVAFPTAVSAVTAPAPAVMTPALAADQLDSTAQLIVFSSPECAYCRQFEQQIAAQWAAAVPLAVTTEVQPPAGWRLLHPVTVTPTTVLFRQRREVARHVGYQDTTVFWRWLGEQILTPAAQHIAYAHGTEPPFTADQLPAAPGNYVDPVTGAALFRSDAAFHSGSGWPSFTDAVAGALTFHADESHGMRRVEVRSASSGIHLGHVFDDGPRPTGKRYCINSQVLRFVPQ